jgi:peptidoglycan/xylan/chitin deacetylase (PgdA/CDA1 family)
MAEFNGLPDSATARMDFARTLAGDLGVDIDDLLRRKVWHSMDRDEVRRLSAEGFSMQVHTHEHLNVVNYPDTVERQAAQCRQLVEAATDRPACHFCYPSGRWCRQAWPALRAAGMETAVTTANGPNFPRTPFLAMRRVLDGEHRSPLAIEFDLCNLKWLLFTLLHPRRRYEARESLVKYRVRPQSF